MFKIVITIKDETIDEIISDISEWYGLTLTRAQCEDFLKKHKEIVCELYRVDWDFDTVERENFIDTIAVDLTGDNWPMGLTSNEDARYFLKKFKKACEEKGYEFKREEVQIEN